MKARRLLRLLETLGYTAARSPSGSHRVLTCAGRTTIIFAFHDRHEIGPAMVRRILVRDAGLTLKEAKEVYRDA